jgi:hypothetical protein
MTLIELSMLSDMVVALSAETLTRATLASGTSK